MSTEVPGATIGIGCKFPWGSDTKDLYYEFLRNKGGGFTRSGMEPKSGFINGMD